MHTLTKSIPFIKIQIMNKLEKVNMRGYMYFLGITNLFNTVEPVLQLQVGQTSGGSGMLPVVLACGQQLL